MSQFLPIKNYKWEGKRGHFRGNKALQKRWLNIILKTKEDSNRGYFVNIRSHFPLKIHDYLKDLLPAVDSIVVKKDWLSPYNKEQMEGIQYTATEKLVPHLAPRDNYVIHYLELQYYVKLRMVIDEIYEVLSFNQSNWLAPYIKLNTELCQNVKNNFEKDFFKLMNNSIYGKTIENVRNYLDVKLLPARNEDDEKKMLKKINTRGPPRASAAARRPSPAGPRRPRRATPWSSGRSRGSRTTSRTTRGRRSSAGATPGSATSSTATSSRSPSSTWARARRCRWPHRTAGGPGSARGCPRSGRGRG